MGSPPVLCFELTLWTLHKWGLFHRKQSNSPYVYSLDEMLGKNHSPQLKRFQGCKFRWSLASCRRYVISFTNNRDPVSVWGGGSFELSETYPGLQCVRTELSSVEPTLVEPSFSFTGDLVDLHQSVVRSVVNKQE